MCNMKNILLQKIPPFVGMTGICKNNVEEGKTVASPRSPPKEGKFASHSPPPSFPPYLLISY